MKVKYAWESLQGATSQCKNAAAKLIFRPHTFDQLFYRGRQARQRQKRRKKNGNVKLLRTNYPPCKFILSWWIRIHRLFSLQKVKMGDSLGLVVISARRQTRPFKQAAIMTEGRGKEKVCDFPFAISLRMMMKILIIIPRFSSPSTFSFFFCE